MVSLVAPESPAMEPGRLKKGDIIVGIDDVNIIGFNDLVVATRRLKPGSQTKVFYLRNGEPFERILTVGGQVEVP